MKSYKIINENRDFLRLYRSGKSKVSPILVTYLRKNKNGGTRIGITASKKVGCAVKRNRSKRIIRAAFRTLEKQPQGYDIIFVARGKTPFCKMQQIRDVMASQLEALTTLK